MDKEKKAKRVRRGTSIAALRTAIRENRLYEIPREEPIEKSCLEEILNYVQGIDKCCNDSFTDSIDDLWKEILSDGTLIMDCMMQKGKYAGQVCWYRVMTLISFLYYNNVYDHSLYTPLKLHMILEGETNSVYTNSGRYPLSDTEQRKIKGIIKAFKRRYEEI